MAEDEEIKNLRTRHSELLEDISDADLRIGGFQYIPDVMMDTYKDAWQKKQALPSQEKIRKNVDLMSATLGANQKKDTPIIKMDEPKELASDDYNVDISLPPIFSDSITVSQEALQKADKDPSQYSAQEIEIHQSNYENKKDSPNMIDYAKAVKNTGTDLGLSLLGYLEPIDYIRRLSWWAGAKAGEALPDSDTLAGEILKEAAGLAGYATEYVLGTMLADPIGYIDMGSRNAEPYLTTGNENLLEYKPATKPYKLPIPISAPSFLIPYEKILDGTYEEEEEDEDYITGLGEVLFERLYDSVASGEMADLSKRSEMNLVPFVDKLNVPYISGVDLGNKVMPKEIAMDLAEKAKQAGMPNKAEELERLATDDLYRSMLFLLPEILLDPLWFFGPAKGGQLVSFGGRNYMINDAAVKASRAVAKIDSVGLNLNEAQRIIVNASKGDEVAIGQLESLANTLEKQSKSNLEKGKALQKASELEAPIKNAQSILASQAQLLEASYEKQSRLANAIINNPKSSVKAKSSAKRTLSSIQESKEPVMSSLIEASARLAADPAQAVKFLKSESKRSFAKGTQESSDLDSLNFVVKAIQQGTNDVNKMARINQGYNFHIPFTTREGSFNHPMYRNGLTVKPRPGDTVMDISNRHAIDEIDLAHLNGFSGENAISSLQQKIDKGESIIFQVGKKPLSGSELASSIIPGGLAFNFTKGIWREPLVKLVDMAASRSILDPINLNRINRLETQGKPLSFSDAFTKFLFTTDYVKEVSRAPTNAVDYVSKWLGKRFAQPLIAGEQLQRALRYVEEANIPKVRSMGGETPSENALIYLMKVNPDLWQSYTNATREMFNAVQSHTDEINQFMGQISREAAEIASKRNDGSNSLDILNEIANAREAGTIDRLSIDEINLYKDLERLISSVANKSNVIDGEERVRQSLISIARFTTKEKSQQIQALREAKEVGAMLKPLLTKSKSEVRKTLTSRLKKLKARLKTKKITPNEVVEVQKQIEAIKNIRYEIKKRGIAQGSDSFNALLKADKEAIIALEKKTKDLVFRLEELKVKTAGVEEARIKTPAGAFSKKGDQVSYNRQLLNWEQDLMTQYYSLIDDLQKTRVASGKLPLSERSIMVATFTILQDAPSAIKDPEGFRSLSERYASRNGQIGRSPRPTEEQSEVLASTRKEIQRLLTIENPTPTDVVDLQRFRNLEDQVMGELFKESSGFVPQAVGQRFGQPLPEDLEAIRKSMDELFGKYNQLYKSRGFDFVKDPVERMRLWGVIDYVPHLRKDFVQPILDHAKKTGKSFDDVVLDEFSRGALDKSLSMSMDQAKKRVIAGTIQEINSLPKGNNLTNWTFSADPISLGAHFRNASKAISNNDLLVTYLKTGVIRTFNNLDEARARQYVPLFNHGEYARDAQILISGNSGDIRSLIQAQGISTEQYIQEYRKLLKAAQENGTHIGAKEKGMRTWADDIEQLRNVDSVEQSLSGINLHRVSKGQEAFDVMSEFATRMEVAMQTAKLDLERKIAKYKSEITNLKSELAKKPTKTKRLEIGIESRKKKIQQATNSLLEDHADFLKIKANTESKVWQSITEDINISIAAANSEKNPVFQVFESQGRLPNISPRSLSLYMSKDQEMFRLYVPAAVQESLTRLTVDLEGTLGRVAKLTKKGLDAINNWWKSTITIMSTAFTARNILGNTFTNVLDVGIGGALNLDTNIKSLYFAVLVDYHAKYGSIDNAFATINKTIRQTAREAKEASTLLVKGQVKKGIKRAGERVVGSGGKEKFHTLATEKIELELALKMFGVKDGRQLVDLGDGILKGIDQHLTDLTRFGVINGSSTFRADINEVVYQYEKMARDMCLKEASGIEKSANIIKPALSIGEDVIYTALPFMLGAPLVAVPKFMGRALARRAENQGRMVNYIANIKRGKTPQESAMHVEKFLFNYGDLTQWQKTWIRSVIPFFTWNQKNVLLHLEMMQKNPSYYAQFYKFFYVAMPELVESYSREQEEQRLGIELTERRGNALAAERIRKSPRYKSSRITLPLDPLNNVYLQGLGLPLEGFMQQVAIGTDVVNYAAKTFKTAFGDTQPRGSFVEMASPYFAQTHVLARLAVEYPFDVDIFRGESILSSSRSNDVKFEYQQANAIGNLVHGLLLRSGVDAKTPKDVEESIASGKGSFMAQYIMNQLDIQIVADPENGVLHYHIPTGKLDALRLFNLTPYERIVRESVAVQDLNNTMLYTPESLMSGQKIIPNSELSLLRALSAYTGIKVKQDIPDYLMYKMFEDRIKQMQLDYQVRQDNIGR